MRQTIYRVCKHVKNFFVNSNPIKIDLMTLEFEGSIPYGSNHLAIRNVGVFPLQHEDDLSDIANARRLRGSDWYIMIPDEIRSRGDRLAYACDIPLDFQDLAEEIFNYTQDPTNAKTNVRTESVNGRYSFTKTFDSSTGKIHGWQQVFEDGLNPYRKLFLGVKL